MSTTTLDHPLKWEGSLRAAGLRVTKSRLAVLDALERFPHADADTIVDAITTESKQTSAQTVYGVLAALENSGLIRRIELPGSSWRYETRVSDNHHHLLCNQCGRIEDVDCVVGDGPCMQPSDAHGFDVHRADVLFVGLCPSCREQATTTTMTTTQGTRGKTQR